jgi:hypothetical protein
MNGDFVSWRDYQGLSTMGDQVGALGGVASADEVSALNKALMAGQDINNPGTAPGVGFPLRLESLDSTLFNVTYQMKGAGGRGGIPFWASLYKDAATNTVEEFDQLVSYGSGNAVWMNEGALPAEDTSTYARNYTVIKYMGTVRRVSMVMGMLRSKFGDIMAREAVNGTMFLLRQLERTLFDGDENMMPVQMDGLEKLSTVAWGNTALDDGYVSGYESDNVIDLRGNPLSEDHIADMVERLIAEPNYGRPSDLWLPPGPVKDLSKIMYPKERYDLPAPKGGMAGISIQGVSTPFGNIKLQNDIFIPDSTTANAAGVGQTATRPNPPVLGAITTPAYAGTNTTYWGAADAGTYIYQVVACSALGKSAPVTSGGITVAALDQVSIPVTDGGNGTTYYEIYRSDLGGTAATCRFIMKVASAGALTTLVDLNRFLPNCSKGYMLSGGSEVMKIKQLAPFTKVPLATIDTSVRWAQILLLALQIQKPLHNGIFINIGKLPTGAFA